MAVTALQELFKPITWAKLLGILAEGGGASATLPLYPIPGYAYVLAQPFWFWPNILFIKF